MKAWIYKNEHGKSTLCVDVYNRLSKRKFANLLSELDGVKITKKPTIFHPTNFCSFEYKGESFTIVEDDFDYCFNINPQIPNQKSLEVLEKYFLNLNIPKQKTRPVFWVAGAVLVGLAIYANIQSS
jgi:hypothetical protein